MQFHKTIGSVASISGIGLHTGQVVSAIFRPAVAGSGIYFVRRDLPNSPFIRLSANNIIATNLATTVGEEGFSIATVEHCLSAVVALGIDNILIEVEGPELPICDGSAKEYLKVLKSVGIVEQDTVRDYIYVTQPIYIGNQDKYAYAVPYNGFRITSTIDFPHPVIGKQTFDLDVNPSSFESHVASARTFGFANQVEELKAKGLIKGGSLENAVVIGNDGILNSEGLRFKDEFIRHKVLDAIGDMATLGQPFMGHLVLYKAGHDLMNKMVSKILEQKDKVKNLQLFRATNIGPSIETDLGLQTLYSSQRHQGDEN